MRGLIQRVTEASVAVGGETIGEIGPGLLVLLGVERGDEQAQADRMMEKLHGYRIFSDAEGRMNLSVSAVGGAVLLVSQFTLVADTSRGMRPGFSAAADPAQAERLYEVALEFAQIGPDDHVYDLYCGCGTISLFAADLAKKVTGVELVPEAVEAAKKNAERNGVSNCHFIAGDMLKTFTEEFVQENGRPSVVIVDPPRAGLHPKVARRLSKLGAERIVYVSCNPLSQVHDLAELNTYYHVEKVQPVDLFPQTHHIENVVLLTKREEK